MTSGGSSDPNSTGQSDVVVATAQGGRAPLDDVMIAMDVVDTLRHDEILVERELNEDERKSKLIERLREIYRGQGIDVPDRILAEGVAALEEDRFVYKPPSDSLATRLAKLYVTRGSWGRYMIGAIGAVAALWIAWYAVYERPRQNQIAANRVELTETLPARLEALQREINAATDQAQFKSSVPSAVRRGLAAAQTGNLAEARAARAELEERLAKLKASYKIQIVSRKGELSGFWRVPKVNRRARNYYLVVEAVDGNGRVLKQSIVNEETSKRETVDKWAVRVPREILESVKADKSADGIIDRTRVGEKRAGFLEPEWFITLSGGAITSW